MQSLHSVPEIKLLVIRSTDPIAHSSKPRAPKLLLFNKCRPNLKTSCTYHQEYGGRWTSSSFVAGRWTTE